MTFPARFRSRWWRWSRTGGSCCEEANDGAPSDGDAAVAASTGYKTTVTMTFEPLEDGRTLVSIAEEGWRETANGLKASYGNCQGWMQMLCAMKAYIEYGINLRQGMFK